MLRYLLFREIGFHSPRILQKTERSRRTYTITSSRRRELLSPHQGAIHSLHIDPAEGRYLLCGGADAVVSIFDLEDTVWNHLTTNPPAIIPIGQSSRGVGHSYAVSCVQWYSHDNGSFFTGGLDAQVKAWDPNVMKPVNSWLMEGKVYSISYPPSTLHHYTIAVGTSDQKGRLIDLRSKTTAQSLLGHRDSIWAVQWFLRDEFLLATGSCDRTIRFWDIRKAGPLAMLDQHNAVGKKTITHKKFTISSSHSSTETAHNGNITSLAFTPDGHFLLSTGTDNRMRCWNASTGENTLVNYAATRNESKCGNQLAISRNGEVVFHPNGEDIHAYRIHTGELISKLHGHFDRVNGCIFHPFQEELYSGGSDHHILVWTPPERKEGIDPQDSSDESDNWSD